MTAYRVLSLDGGGIRGVLSTMILMRLEAASPFLENVNLIAGTSTGGIIALGLAMGKTPAEILHLYRTLGARVFADSFADDLLDLGKAVGAEYTLDDLRRALLEEFDGKTLSDLHTRVLVSSFDLDNAPVPPGRNRTWKAKFFHNFPGVDSDGEQMVVDVALRTVAAPTYFPIYQGYIDGGVVANNPSMCALAQALHQATGGQSIEDVVLLSVGTGHNPRYLEVMNADWGLAQWARHLVNLMLEGSVDLANYQCRQALGPRYLRINPLLPEAIGMDAVDQMALLIDIAKQVDLTEAIDWLDEHFSNLKTA